MSGLSAFLRVPTTETAARADLVVQQLETAIAVGLLTNGERLPPESELAAELGVSTGSLRQALTILRDRRIIRTRPGRNGGSVIAASAATSQQTLLEQLRARSTEELRDLGDVCGAALGAAARLAAARAVTAEIAGLRGLAQTLVIATDDDACRRADSRFHIQLGVIAQSPRLTMELVQLQGEFAPLRWMSRVGEDSDGAACRQHLAIVEAIEQRDGQLAQARVIAHCEEDTRLVIDAHMQLAMTDSDGVA